MKAVAIVLAVPVILVAYVCGKREDVWYRVTTSIAAVRAIAAMPEEKLERFLKSYEMFEKDQFVGEPGEVDLLTDYYSVLNHLCAIGNFEKMYLPPYLDASKDVYENQRLYEKQMANYLEIKNGSKVVDIGCGRGRIAHHVASYTGAHVTGLNVDEEQIRLAREYADQTGLRKQLDFKVANYNDRLPFADDSLDAAYYVQVLSYSTNLTAFFSEVYRVVKPGAKVAFEDYVMGNSFDENNPEHQRMKNIYKPVLGGVDTSYPHIFKAAVERAGFQVVLHKDASINERQWPLLEQEANFWLPVNTLVKFLYRIHLVPRIYHDVMERMTQGTYALIEADRQGLVSCGYVTYAYKPA